MKPGILDQIQAVEQLKDLAAAPLSSLHAQGKIDADIPELLLRVEWAIKSLQFLSRRDVIDVIKKATSNVP